MTIRFFHSWSRHQAVGAVCLALAWPAFSAPEQTPARVVVTDIKEREIRKTAATVGIVSFDRVANLAPEVSGLIEIQHTREGDLVTKGQVLVELNTDFVRQDIAIQRKELEEIDAELIKSKKSLKRLEKLLRTSAASREAYDVALYDHQALAKRGERLGETVRRLELQLAKSRVRAPFAGLILQKFKERGEWVGPEAPVVEIASTDGVVVIVPVSESVVRFQQPGAKVPVRIEAAGLELTGTVLRLDPVADLRSKSVSMKVAVPYDPAMRKNMSANATITISEKRRLRLIDRDALVRIDGGEHVYLVEGTKAKRIPVNIVARLGDEVAVEDPEIQAGMQVVIDGNDRLRPGQPLTVVEIR